PGHRLARAPARVLHAGRETLRQGVGHAQRAVSEHGQRPAEADFSRIRTVPVAARANKVRAADLSHPPGSDRSFAAFLDSLPDILEARSFRTVVDALAAAAREGRGVLCMMGGHVVKTGLAPVLIDLMERGVITHLASNGSTVIHDYELAR